MSFNVIDVRLCPGLCMMRLCKCDMASLSLQSHVHIPVAE